MKNTIILFIMSLTLTAAANEHARLQAAFKKDSEEANKTFQKAFTTVELSAAAGHNWEIAEKKLYLALDFKLRHTQEPQKRLKMLKDFHTLSREVQKILDTPNARERYGSLASMRLYHRIAQLMEQQTATLMLRDENEKRWQRIADAVVCINSKKIPLKNGRAEFKEKMYDQMQTLEIILFPKNTFTWQNRDFAVIRTDIPCAANDDFANTYLCEFKNGQLVVHTQCEFPLISAWTLTGNTFVFSDQAKKQTILLK